MLAEPLSLSQMMNIIILRGPNPLPDNTFSILWILSQIKQLLYDLASLALSFFN